MRNGQQAAKRAKPTIVSLRPREQVERSVPGVATCEQRAVARDGRIVCNKIVAGDNEVSPDTCRTCPARAVNCAHLQFSLRLTAPSRLVVRYNGREEVWDDEPPRLCFEHAACAARVLPVDHPRACAGCSLRAPLQSPSQIPGRRAAVSGSGKVVPFRPRRAASG